MEDHFRATTTGPDPETAALGVSQPKTASAELLSQDAVLLFQVFDHFQLPAVHPAGEEVQQEYRAPFMLVTLAVDHPCRRRIPRGNDAHLHRGRYRS